MYLSSPRHPVRNLLTHSRICQTHCDGKGLAHETYKDGNPSEQGIYQTHKLALYISIPHWPSNSYTCKTIGQVLRMHGPDGGFHTGYDTAGTYAGTLENAETTSISIIALNATLPSTVCLICALPRWIFCVIGFAGAVAHTVVLVVLFGKRRSKPTRHSSQNREINP